MTPSPDELRKLLADLEPPTDWTDEGYSRIDHLIDNDPITLGRRYEQTLRALPSLVDELDRLRTENDTLHDDVLRFVTQRNLVCERLAAHIIPGPDAQDDIDRRRLIREVFEDSWDEVDGWREQAAKGAMVIAERDRLRSLLEKRTAQQHTVDRLEGELDDYKQSLSEASDLIARLYDERGDARRELDELRSAAHELFEAEKDMEILDRESEEVQECGYDFASQQACFDRAIQGRHRYADARRALRSLVEAEDTTEDGT